MKRPDGSFFESIAGPGKEKLPQDREIANPNWRTQIKEKAADQGLRVQNPTSPLSYQVSFRSGGGMAIAALALASTMPADGDFSRATYLRTAEEASGFLRQRKLWRCPSETDWNGVRLEH